MDSNKILRPIIENIKNLTTFKIYDDFYSNKLTPNNVCVSCLHMKYVKKNCKPKHIHGTNQHKHCFWQVLNMALNLFFVYNLIIDFILVAGEFPQGKVPITSQVSEVEHAILYGAKEIDLVIDHGLTINGDFESLYYNINRIKSNVKLKTILSVTELESFTIVYKAAMTAMMAGSDFISTSTGMCVKKSLKT